MFNKLKHDPDLLTRYDSIIQEQLKAGVIEKVPTTENSITQRHYIPHHDVVNPLESTKVRKVYDASARTKSTNKSLNECLHRGPVLLKDLVGLLLRFRLKKIALIADIEKAFLQLSLQHKERDVTRPIWLKDKHSTSLDRCNLQEYRFCVECPLV